MQLGFYFDQRRCNGCYTCVIACKEWHGIPAGTAFWRRLITIEEGRFPRPWLAHISLSCFHCATPACVPACPASAIHKRDEDGIVVVDQSLCILGCRSCLHACPYDAPQFRTAEAKMEKCDLCEDRLQEGKEPMCVATCPLRALKAGPMDDLKEAYGAEGVECLPGLPGAAQTSPSALFRPK
ncbi:MAG: 4Fe-4S dicluster domain-containing protein [Chloroflexi bacterium]|nr:4Fe-4S dicluster domain-containing protein [Chloroflexota bacterium]